MIDVGVGLWAMRSTAGSPANVPALHLDLQADARFAEALGLHSLWLCEHHFWYDGWCPSLLVAAAAVLGATTRLHVGTGVFLLPLHDPARVAAAGLALEQMAPGRTELGVGLGYRDAEFDGHGVSRRLRGRRADAALDHLGAAWADGGPRLLVGGIAERSLRRGAEHGLGLFLPSSMTRDQVRRTIDRARESAAAAGARLGRVGMLANAWVTDGSAVEERLARDRIRAQAREYGGAWWRLDGRVGFDAPDLLDAQMERNEATAVVGPPEVLVAHLRDLETLGVDLAVLHVASEESRPAHREAMARIAHDVLPALR